MFEFVHKIVNPDLYLDESKQAPGMINVGSWIGNVYPVGDKQRIVIDRNYFSHQLRLQAFVNNNWQEVMMYDDGYDEYGKLKSGKWVPLSDKCAWTEEDLKRIIARMNNKKLEVKVCYESS